MCQIIQESFERIIKCLRGIFLYRDGHLLLLLRKACLKFPSHSGRVCRSIDSFYRLCALPVLVLCGMI